MMKSETAQEEIFKHWDYLQRIAQKRFPGNEIIAEEALTYVQDALAANQWERVRVWDGVSSSFKTFITKITLNLMTDFYRKRFGHLRKPEWLSQDLLKQHAYEYLIEQNYDRFEAIETLCTIHPERERSHIESVVAEVLARSRKKSVPQEQGLEFECLHQLPGDQLTPDEELISEQAKKLLYLLQYYLESDEHLPEDPNFRSLLTKFKQLMTLTNEDLLLLRMRYLSGLKKPVIANRLNLKGKDAYKAFNKKHDAIIAQLRFILEQIQRSHDF